MQNESIVNGTNASTNGTAGRVFALAVGGGRGGPKPVVEWARFQAGQGIEDDGGGFSELRQVSLVARESLYGQETENPGPAPGHCGENVRFEGMAGDSLHVGSLVKVGKAVLLITKKGKKCLGNPECPGTPEKCPVAGNWLFARVMNGGQVCLDDDVKTATFSDIVEAPSVN